MSLAAALLSSSSICQSSSLLITNRVIFQILFAKLRAASIRSGLRLRSWPGVPLVASVKRSASVPC